MKHTIEIKVDTLKINVEADSNEEALQMAAYIINKFPKEIIDFKMKEIKSLNNKPIDLEMFGREVQGKFLEDLKKPSKKVLDALGMK